MQPEKPQAGCINKKHGVLYPPHCKYMIHVSMYNADIRQLHMASLQQLQAKEIYLVPTTNNYYKISDNTNFVRYLLLYYQNPM